jgi:hypothetical protein
LSPDRGLAQATALMTLFALALLAACGTEVHPADEAGSVSTTTTAASSTTTTTTVVAPTTTITSATTSTPVPTAFQSVDWDDIEVPGSVCHASEPIQMSQGNATIPTPAGVDAGTPQVDISEWTSVVYGDLYGTGQNVAALNVWCANTGGTADGQLQDSWVIFADEAGTLQTLTTLTPQQPSTAGFHVPFFDFDPGGIEIQPGQITVKEDWYGPSDATCCPSGQATTVWRVSGDAFTPTTTSQAYPKGT